MNKYKLLKNDYLDVKHPVTKKPVRLYRILALKSFESKGGSVREGSIGGFVSDESNMTQNDSSWVFNQAKIFDNALLIDSSLLDDAIAYQNAIIQDSICRGHSHTLGDCTVINSLIADNVTVEGESKIEDCKIFDASRVYGKPILERTVMHDGVVVRDTAKVIKCVLRDTVTVKGVSEIEGCHFSGHTIIANSKHLNETRKTDVELTIEQQIFPEGQSAIK